MLLNDTAVEPHVGCQAVSDAHARMLGAAGHRITHRYFLGDLRRFAGMDECECIDSVLRDDRFMAEVDSVDAVIVNGEGTLHHGAGTEYFAVLGAAQRRGKLTAIVNSVFEAQSGWAQVLQALDDFCVRDARSLAFARARGLNCRLVPDSLLEARFVDRALIELNERIAVTDWHPQRDQDVGAALSRVLDSVPEAFYFPLMHGVHAHLWRHAPATLGSASWILTARHHGVYLALLTRRPFVAFPSNTSKIEGLIEASGARIPVCSSADQIEEAMCYGLANLDEYDRLAEFVAAHRPLSTFRILGQSRGESSAEDEVAGLEAQLSIRSWARKADFWSMSARDRAVA